MNGVVSTKLSLTTVMNAIISIRSPGSPSGLSSCFWAEALKCAAYIRNRVSTGSNRDKLTPYQKLFGKTPNVSHFRIFGCDAFVHRPIKNKFKLSSKARKGTFLGYKVNSPMYKVLMWDNNRMERSRNVTFDEACFTRRRARLTDVNPNLSPNDVYNDVFPDTASDITNASASSSSSGNTTSETSSITSSDNPSALRRSTRPSSKPDRLSYDKLGFINSNKTNDTLLALIEHIEHTMITINHTPMTYAEAICDSNKLLWIDAIKSELDSLQSLNTWTIVDSSNTHPHHILNSKWVFKVKQDQLGNITKLKARLVVNGYEQQKGIDFFDTLAPVARPTSIRTLIALSAYHGMFVHQMDVNTAFLNALVNEDLYINAPDGLVIPPNHILKLNKALYGLKQAPRVWNHTIQVFITSLGLIYPCIYIRSSDTDIVFVAIYVDDILISCVNETIITDLKQSIPPDCSQGSRNSEVPLRT